MYNIELTKEELENLKVFLNKTQFDNGKNMINQSYAIVTMMNKLNKAESGNV